MKKYSQTLNIGIILLLLSILLLGCSKKADELPDWQVDVSYVDEAYIGETSNFVVRVSKKCDITLYVDGTQQQSVSSTKLNFDVSTLPVGLHNIKISINDGYGTYDKSYQCRIKEKPVVYQKPTITCHKLEQANYGESSVITASTKTDSEMMLYVDGAKQQSTTSKTLSFDVVTLSVGTHQIKIVAVNGDKKDEVSFNCEIVDNTPVLSCNTIERCNYGETAILTASTQIDSKITLYVDGAEMQSSASRELRYDVSELSVGTHQIKIVAVNGDKKDEVSFNCEIVKVADEYVDLGLPSGTLWATCNVGAENPWDYGDYFAWGEVTTKDYYDWSTYKYANGSEDKLTKYCNNSYYGNDGFADNLTVLQPEDDAATANLGSDWRMPTQAEFQELYDNCDWEWTSNYNGTGVAGRIVKSRNNSNSLFLPAAGYRRGTALFGASSIGNYWSSSLDTDYPRHGRVLDFYSGNVNPDGWSSRQYGQSVRAVRCKN